MRKNAYQKNIRKLGGVRFTVPVTQRVHFDNEKMLTPMMDTIILEIRAQFHAQKVLLRPNKKKVSASTNPTDRVLKRRPDTFFRLRVRYFWRRSVRGQLRRRSQSRERSRRVNQAKGRRSWLLTQAFEPRYPGARRDVRRYSIDATWFLSAAGCSTSWIIQVRFLRLAASTSKLTCGFISFFWPIRSCPALISCFSSTAMPVAGSVNFPADKKPFCRGRLLQVDGDATCYGLRLEITSLWIHASHFNSRDLTKQEKTGAMFFFHIIVENDQAELKAEKLETADSSSLHVRTWPTVQHTRAA